MKAKNNSVAFQSLVLSIVAVALMLAGTPRLWGQCDPSIMAVPTLTVSPDSLIGSSMQTAKGNVTATNVSSGGAIVNLNSPPYLAFGGPEIDPLGRLEIPAGQTSGSFTIVPIGDVVQPTTVSVQVSIGQCSSSQPVTITPNAPTLSLSPSGVIGGGTQKVTGTVTMTAAGLSDLFIGITSGYLNLGGVELCGSGVCVRVRAGKPSGSFTVVPYGVAQETTVYVKAGLLLDEGILFSTAALELLPGSAVPSNPADQGHPACVLGCGNPINLSTGNVWIDQRDYSVPGLGGGLELSRVWNSRWPNASPPNVAGMFGMGWMSTYEEQIVPLDSQDVIYWRADGSGWTFTYNPTLSAYFISSPPNERATLTLNPANGGFTLALPDGTQKLFNAANKLAAIIDRNQNQTTLGYDITYRLVSVASPGGTTLTFSYNDPNNPTQVTTVQDGVGTVATYTYDSSSRLTQVLYPDTSSLNFTFDANSNIATVKDSQGKLIEAHTYDSQNRGLTSTRANNVDNVSLSY